MQYKPVMESIQKAKVIITKLNTLISGWQKAKGKTVKLYDKSSEKLTEEHYVPNRPELMFSSCCSKAAVPFRWRFTAVGTLSCADSLMLLPLTSKTRTRGWAVKLFSLVYWKKNSAHVTATAWVSLCGDPPFFVSPWAGDPPLLPLCYSPCLLLIILFRFLGDTEGKEMLIPLYCL